MLHCLKCIQGSPQIAIAIKGYRTTCMLMHSLMRVFHLQKGGVAGKACVSVTFVIPLA